MYVGPILGLLFSLQGQYLFFIARVSCERKLIVTSTISHPIQPVYVTSSICNMKSIDQFPYWYFQYYLH